MNAHVGAPSHTLRAAVAAAEAISLLPAVPTQDWCDRAAGSLLSLRQPSIVLVAFSKLAGRGGGSVERVESVGVAGCSVAEVGTTLRRVRTHATVVALEQTHPSIGRVRAAAHHCADLGWAPGDREPDGPRAAPAAALNGGGSLVRSRWTETGASEVVVGAARLGGPETGRFLIVEIGLLGEPADGADDAALLDSCLPALARRAEVAFGGAPFTESTCLTRREEQVLEHLLYGKSVRQIAAELERSQHTVHDHVKSLHRKLAASSRGALIARALGHVRPPGAGRAAGPGAGGNGLADH